VCAAAIALLSLQPEITRGPDGDDDPHRARPAWLAPGLAVVILAMGLVYAPRPQTGLAQEAPTWTFPDRMVTETEPLRPDEVAWLTRDGAESAERFRFKWPADDGESTISGSLMLIASRTWRAQHRPERCFEVYGLALNGSQVQLIEPDFPIRSVSLGDDEGRDVASASYWFQSAERTTADYGTRMWADLTAERERWVLVTMVFEDVRDPRDADAQALYGVLHDAVARNLNEG
jgi:exosortase O